MAILPVAAKRIISSSSDVSRMQVGVAARTLRALPKADRQLLAHHGIRIELVGSSSLGDGMLGATSIVRESSGRWVPTRIRIAAKVEGRGPESLSEVIQHEIGHAVSVLREQDRSEDAARRFARAH